MSDAERDRWTDLLLEALGQSAELALRLGDDALEERLNLEMVRLLECGPKPTADTPPPMVASPLQGFFGARGWHESDWN